MKISRLELKAFGPFTDLVLDFSGPTPGLHIVFGRNEAGKSSSLRGLKALLYGFPERTSDNFVHPNDQLLVAGRLQGADGRELSFQRRKKRKADLLDAQGDPLDGSKLTAFLHGIEPTVFDTLFGIDHETLVSGGQDILEQKGEVGRSLFAAGTGIASLRRILTQLHEESDALFKARGSKPEINQALSEYRELQKTLREASLAGSEWKKHRQALTGAEAELAELRNEQRRCERRRRHLERLRQALPQLAQRRALLAQLADLGEVVPLPEDFSIARRRAQEQKRAAEQRLLGTRRRLTELEERAAGLQPPQTILDQADNIDELARRLGEYRKGLQDRPGLDGRRRQLKSEAASLLRQLRPDLALEKIESLRPMLARRKTIHQLGARAQALEQARQSTERQVRHLSAEGEKIRRTLDQSPPAPDFSTLQTILEQALKAGQVDEDLRDRSHAAARDEEALAVELKRLGIWSGSWRELRELCLPAAETLNHQEDRLRRLHEEQERLEGRRQELEGEHQRLLRDKAVLEAAGELPSEEDLRQIRDRRAQGWHLLRRQWLNGEDVALEARAYDAEQPLPEAFEQTMREADLTADRLRHEAERVHQRAALIRQVEDVRAQLAQIQDLHARLAEAVELFHRQWRELWAASGIAPRSPREMALWLSGMEKLRLRVETWQRACDEIEERRARREGLRRRLLDVLLHLGQDVSFPGKELAEVVVAAQTLLRRCEQAARQRADLQERLGEIEDELRRALVERDEAQRTLDAWRGQWREVLGGLGLSADALPGEVEDFLESLQTCFEYLRQAEEFHKRIEGIDRDGQNYAEAVRALQTRIAPDLADLAPDQTVVQLQALLNRARTEHSRLQQIEEDHRQLSDDLHEAQTDLRGAEEDLARLSQVARCAGADQLEQVERIWAEHQRLRERLADVDERLVQIGEGLTLEELQQQAAEVDGDELPTRIAELTREAQERLEPEISRLNQLIGEARTELQRMDGSGRAALAAEDAERTLARLRRLAERYARLRVAAQVLDDEIERFRAQNQDPLLTIASRLFARLTQEAFAGLRADVGDQGQAVLVGVRADGSRLEVGGMSSGTRDQLYLALRLASLEWRLERHDPMPFIVDDILINFDDERSRATLEALADLGRRNQVILFTHHRQVVETARRLDAEGVVFVHELKNC
ncbi:AAA family ATPase [Geoalkalibacter halelectricus]|uniref:AAA family ATPase n=1 Tax=Geoalkalibacter halelectricus TaxID=2847045 RepID=UPI003D213C7F